MSLPALLCAILLAVPALAQAQNAPVAEDDFATARSGPLAGAKIVIDAAANDFDPDGDTLTYSAASGEFAGEIIVDPDGTIYYTPPADYTGQEVFGYIVSDGVDDVLATVTVDVVADLAPIANDDSATTPADTQVSIPVLANDTDPDGDILSEDDLSIVQSPAHGSLTVTCNPECQPLDYQPNPGYVGNDTFTYHVFDALGALSNTATVTISVTEPNAPPVAGDDTGIARSGLTAGEQIQINAAANDSDPDGDSLTWTLDSGSYSATIEMSPTGVITYTPPPDTTGVDTFSYTVTDGINPPVTGNVSVTVIANQAPVANDDSATTPVDTQVSIPVLANDTDPDGDNLSEDDLSIVQSPAHGSLTVTCNPECQPLDYQPNPGYVGNDTFTYHVFDALGALSNTATVTITVTEPNAPPVAGDDAIVLPLNLAPQTIDPRSNDTDADGDPLTITAVTQAGAGTVTFTATSVTYTNTGSFSEADSFTYTVADGQGGTATATVVVTLAANSPPVAGDDTGIARSGPTAGEQIQIDAAANDSDPDEDTLSFSAGTAPANGTVIVSPSGLLRYTPNPGFTGLDTFTYAVSDGVNPDVSGNVSVTVVADQAPVASDDSATTPTATAVSIPVLANDTDPDGDALDSRVVLVQQPASGTVNQACSDVCLPPEYTPNAGFVGNDTFTYRAVDALGAQSNIATVTINVTAVARPAAVDDTAITDLDTQVSIDVSANDSNPGNRPLTVALSGATSQQGGTLAITAGTNLVAYTPPSGFSGQDSFTYILRDDLLNESSATVTVTVIAANQVPVAVIAGGNRSVADTDGAPGETVTFDSTQSTDADGTVSFCQWTVNGVGQDASCGANVPFALNDGSNTVQLVVFDDSETASAPATVTITVQSNAAPTAVIAGGNRSVADTNGVPGEAVAVDGSGSSDGTGTISAYQWSVNGRPVVGASGARPTLALDDGANTVSLVVVDNVGLSSAPAQVIITVVARNAAPVVSIKVGSTSIPDGDGEPGEIVPFSGVATDSDGSVAVDSFRWRVNGQAVAGANGVANPLLALADGSNAVSLSVTDNGGTTGSQTITVVIGDPGALADLPGVKGNKNLENTANATDSTCSALLKASAAQLKPEQADLRASCESIYANVEENPADIADALRQVSGQQVTALQTTAIDFTSSQLFNVAERLTALRRGESGVSAAGLNVTGANLGLPLSAIESLSRTLFGEGGSGGDDEGGLFDDRLGFFMNGSIRFGDKEATARESGFDIDTQGVTLGVDYRFTDALVAGLALGYGKASADFDASGGSQDSDSYSGSLYGSWYGQRSYFDGIASLGSVSYDTLRKIDLFDGAIVDQALGSTDGTQLALGLATGMDFGKSGLRFGPNLALNYIKVDIDGFRERTTGSSGLAMSFSDQSADSLRLKAGGHFSYSYSRKWGILSPQARFDIVREFANESQQVSVRYANDPTFIAQGGPGGTFVIFTDDPDDYSFLWAVGLAAQFVNGLSGFIDYEQTEALDTISSGEFSLGLRYQTSFR